MAWISWLVAWAWLVPAVGLGGIAWIGLHALSGSDWCHRRAAAWRDRARREGRS